MFRWHSVILVNVEKLAVLELEANIHISLYLGVKTVGFAIYFRP